MINKGTRKLDIAKRPLPRRLCSLECPFSKQLHEAFRTMQPGESFLLDNEDERKHAFRVAYRYGIKITTRKVNGCGYQIELV